MSLIEKRFNEKLTEYNNTSIKMHSREIGGNRRKRVENGKEILKQSRFSFSFLHLQGEDGRRRRQVRTQKVHLCRNLNTEYLHRH